MAPAAGVDDKALNLKFAPLGVYQGRGTNQSFFLIQNEMLQRLHEAMW